MKFKIYKCCNCGKSFHKTGDSTPFVGSKCPHCGSRLTILKMVVPPFDDKPGTI